MSDNGAAVTKVTNALNPYLHLGISQAKAEGRDDVSTDSPEMESTLNSRMPFLNAAFGFKSDRLSPGAPYPEVVADAEISYIKNYSILENDQEVGFRLGASTYFWTWKFLMLEGFARGGARLMEREWPSLAIPSGWSSEGEAGLALNLVRPWITGRLYGDGHIGRLGYDEENFGHSVTADDWRLGGGADLQLNYLNNYWKYLPVVRASLSGVAYGMQESPAVALNGNNDGVVEGEVSGGKVELGLDWKDLWKFSLVSVGGRYERESLQDFTPISTGALALTADSPYGRLDVSAGRAFGSNHYYEIDVPYFADLTYTVPEAWVLPLGPFDFRGGIKLTGAIYEDQQRVDRPGYEQYGALLFLDTTVRDTSVEEDLK